MSLNISVGRSCFVQCRGCYNHFGESTELLDTSIILSFLATAKAEGFSKVTLCGGDPLSRPDILELLRGIKDMEYRVHLDTVGTPLLGQAETIFYGRRRSTAIEADQLSQLVDMLGIPLDGPSQRSVALFRRGRPNLFWEQLEILSLLDACNATLCVNTVVHKNNLDELGQMLPLVRRYSCVTVWQLFQYSPSGPLGYRNRKDFEISTEIFESAVHALTEKVDGAEQLSIEGKSNQHRQGKYLLIDSMGIAWMPMVSHSGNLYVGDSATPARNLVGDLRDVRSHLDIIQYAINPDGRT